MFRSVLAVLIAVAPPAAATAQELMPLPAARPWTGRSERLVQPAGAPWATPIERSRFEHSPDQATVRAFLDRLVAASPLLKLEVFGRTGEGRDLLYVRASKGGSGKPVVLVQAGIHSGEIDGKDAGLMLLRDIAMRGKDGLLDKVDLVFVPILNVDGHERASIWNQPHQRGPAEKGRAPTPQGINLNRDYAKADAPETRAIIGLLRALDPALYIDLHVSDGPDMQYDVTYTFAGWGTYARSRATASWLQERFSPAIDAALTAEGHVPGIYPSLIDGLDPGSDLRFAPEGPRYSTGYGDFVAVPTVLVENHSLKPYRQRVLGAYVLLEAALQLVANDGAAIARAKAADRAAMPVRLMTRWEKLDQPINSIDFKGITYEFYPSPASGRQEVRWTGRPVTTRKPVIGYRETQSVAIPQAWWIPADQREVIDRLRLHGIRFEAIDRPMTLDLDEARLLDPKLGPASERRILLRTGLTHATRRVTLPAGTIRVSADQPLRLLAAALLEPESEDSFLAWGFFPNILQGGGLPESFVLAPLAERMLARDPQLRAAFEAKLAADPAFAATGDARLRWFLDQTAYADPTHHVYPVLRQLAAQTPNDTKPK